MTLIETRLGRATRHCQKFLLLPLALIGMWSLAYGQQRPAALEVSQLDVVDDQGRSRIRLSVDVDGGVRVALRDTQGRPAASIAIVDSTTGIEFRRGDGCARFEVNEELILLTLGLDGAKSTEFPAIVVSARRGGQAVELKRFAPKER